MLPVVRSFLNRVVSRNDAICWNDSLDQVWDVAWGVCTLLQNKRASARSCREMTFFLERTVSELEGMKLRAKPEGMLEEFFERSARGWELPFRCDASGVTILVSTCFSQHGAERSSSLQRWYFHVSTVCSGVRRSCRRPPQNNQPWRMSRESRCPTGSRQGPGLLKKYADFYLQLLLLHNSSHLAETLLVMPISSAQCERYRNRIKNTTHSSPHVSTA